MIYNKRNILKAPHIDSIYNFYLKNFYRIKDEFRPSIYIKLELSRKDKLTLLLILF